MLFNTQLPLHLHTDGDLRDSFSLERDLATLDNLVVLSDIEFPQLAGADVVDEAMDLQATFLHGVNDDRILGQDLCAIAHVQLNQLQRALLGVETVEQGQVFLADGPQRHQPGVDQAEFLVVQGGGDASARGVAADDDVLDLEVLDGKLDDGQRVDVRGGQDVGDVAVAEDLARFEAENGGFRAA